MNIEGLGKTIKERRKFLKISQMELSEIAEIGLRNLKDLESGRGNPTLTTVVKVLDVLGLELNIRMKE